MYLCRKSSRLFWFDRAEDDGGSLDTAGNLKKELNNSKSNHTPNQQSVIKKAYDDLVQLQQHDSMSD
jgi:hypothetical protein